MNFQTSCSCDLVFLTFVLGDDALVRAGEGRWKGDGSSNCSMETFPFCLDRGVRGSLQPSRLTPVVFGGLFSLFSCVALVLAPCIPFPVHFVGLSLASMILLWNASVTLPASLYCYTFSPGVCANIWDAAFARYPVK